MSASQLIENVFVSLINSEMECPHDLLLTRTKGY